MLRTAELTAAQLAARYDVVPSTVRRWATRTDAHPPAPHRKDGRGRLRFDPDAVDEWLASTGVLRRSRAQQPSPETPVPITAVFGWPLGDITKPGLTADQREHAARRNGVLACLFCVRHTPGMPTPPDFGDDIEAACDWLESIPPRTVSGWQELQKKALGQYADG